MKKNSSTEHPPIASSFYKAFDSLLEGVQVIGYDWVYLYVNPALGEYSTYTKEELEGHSVLERYPGVEQTDLFRRLQNCMENRVGSILETDFQFPNGTVRFFELRIQPVPEGIFILSIDKTKQKVALERLSKVNRLYAFTSALNKGMVRLQQQQDFLNEVCHIAVEVGGYKIAAVALIDENSRLVLTAFRGQPELLKKMVQHSGIHREDPRLEGTPIGRALHTGQLQVLNSLPKEPAFVDCKEDLENEGIKASASLPIHVFDKLIGILELYAGSEIEEVEELTLLNDAAKDISFALENFERIKKHLEAEARIAQNERRFQVVMEKSSDMKTLSTQNGKIIYASPSITKILGYSEEEFLVMTETQLFHPSDLDGFLAKREAIMETPGASFHSLHRMRHKRGHWLWIESTLTNMLNEPGIFALVSNFRDVSERIRAEQQLEFDRSNLNALINSTNDMMWSVDKNFQLLTSNQVFDDSMQQSLGRSVPQGEYLLDHFPPAQLKRFKKYYERAFTGEIFTVTEFTPLPREMWLEITFHPIREGEKVIGTACHSRDITYRRKTEHDLKESEAFNRGVLNSLTAHIAVIDHSGKIVAANTQWKRFAKAHPKVSLKNAMPGHNYLSLCEKAIKTGDLHALEVLHGIKDVLEGIVPAFYMEYGCETSKSKCWFAIRIKRFESNEPMLVMAHHDITERKMAEEEIIRKNEELEKTNIELDRFVYSASHDLRSPLCSVMGIVSIIEVESKEENTLYCASLIRKNVDRLEEFIRTIIQHSRNNRAELEIQQVPLQQTVEDIIELLRYAKEAEGIHFDLQVEEAVPFYSDKQRLVMVLENLISNAIKYRKPNEPHAFIRVKAISKASKLTLSVEDNGVGIDPTYHGKIFEMFFRLSSQKAGSGIGLYVVREIVKKLNGAIRVESEEGKGTTFVLTLENMG